MTAELLREDAGPERERPPGEPEPEVVFAALPLELVGDEAAPFVLEDVLDEEAARKSPSVEPSGVRIVPLEDFAAEVEASAEPLLGTHDDMALAAGGTLILYGDGGTSKTTLTIDAALHLAAGASWLGLTVPRPLVVLVIENEGPRGPFRRKLKRKQETWAGGDLGGRVHVLEEPWGRFSFAEKSHRAQLAAFVDEHEVDLIVCGPLVALGTIGGGTPDEITAFERLLTDLRARCARPLAAWFAHHENKAGDVSGAWERYPDTLIHARLDGKERTRIHWRKARWSSSLHDNRWTLAWTDGEGFELVDEEASEAVKAAQVEAARAWIIAHVEERPGLAKTPLVDAFAEAHGRGGRALARAAIDAELTASAPRLATGPGKSAAGTYLYPASALDLPLADDLFGEYGEKASDPEAEGPLADLPPPRRGRQGDGKMADWAEPKL